MSPWIMFQLLVFLFIPFLIDASFVDYPSANSSVSWQNNPITDRGNWRFDDDDGGGEAVLRPILAIGRDGYPDFGFGFFSEGTSNAFFLVLVKMPSRNGSTFNASNVHPPPILLWSPNGVKPVGDNATLELSGDGLTLRDADGTTAWFTDLISGFGTPVTCINLNSYGNLRLFDRRNKVVWQSFDSPTNVWLPGQRLKIGQQLVSRSSDSSFAKGLFYLSVIAGNINAFTRTSPPQFYSALIRSRRTSYSFNFTIGSFFFSGNDTIYNSTIKDFQFTRLEPNGHLHVFQLVDGYNQTLYADLLEDKRFGECAYPTGCGKYGICSNFGHCTCPGADDVGENRRLFNQINASNPSLGCAEVTPLSCKEAKLHTFMELSPGVSYFRLPPIQFHTDVEACKIACLRNCSCKAVIFRYRDDISVGSCYLPLEIFSFMTTSKNYYDDNFLSFIKVQNPRPPHRRRKSHLISLIALSVLGGILFVVLVIGILYYFLVWRKRHRLPVERREGEGDRSSVGVSVLLKKFTFEFLISATQNFQIQLGKGGFGSVFEGKLENGTKIAVKRLENQVKKEFMAEVKTMGSVHHFNLVKLLGYCAEKSNRLLVYEYMCNGSLDKWIFPQDRAQTLGWKIRREMIVGIAKGLEYLHVHCNPNIIHFDIKPQNILLDKDFNVKISDFGLAKWIERDQTHVSTLAKGTPGYIAPELIRGRNVSVKVDVYSFGIVMMEIICGRKNSKPFDGEFLIESVKRKAEEGKLVDLVDDRNGEMEENKEEAVKTMEVAIWCLRPYSSRPSMAMVVKVLEGLIEMEPVNDFGFLTMFREDSLSPGEVNGDDWTPLVASTLSGPR